MQKKILKIDYKVQRYLDKLDEKGKKKVKEQLERKLNDLLKIIISGFEG